MKPIIAFFKDRQLGDITPFLIEKFKSERRASKTRLGSQRTVASVNRELQLLSKILSLATDDGKLQTNPCRKAKLLKGGEPANPLFISN